MRRLLLTSTLLIAITASNQATAADPKPAPAVPKAAVPKAAVSLEDLFPDVVVAKGRGFEIRSREVEEAYRHFKTAAAARGQPIPDDKRLEFEKKLVDRLAVVQIMLARATAEDRAKGNTAADRLMADFRKQARTEELFTRQVEALGMTPASFHRQLLERAVVEEVFIREVRVKIPVSDEQVRKVYDENPKRFEVPELVRAAHILIATRDLVTNSELTDAQKKDRRELAEALKLRAREGEDFAKLAKDFSQDPGSKDSGGEYTFPRGQMAIEFETAAFALEPGRISEVVATKFGYHIIKVFEKTPMKVAEFEKVKERIKENLAQDEADKLMPAYLEKMKQEAGLEILDARYK